MIHTKLPQDIINYELPKYLPMLDIYKERKNNHHLDGIFEERLEVWSTFEEPWVMAATSNDVELIKSLLKVRPSLDLPDITYYGSSGVNAVINMSLDNFNRDVAEILMDRHVNLLRYGRDTDGECNRDDYYPLMRMTSLSDKWTGIFFDKIGDVYQGAVIWDIYRLARNHRDFLQTIERGFKIGILDEKWTLKSAASMVAMDNNETQMDLIKIYKQYNKRVNFDSLSEDIESIFDRQCEVDCGVRSLTYHERALSQPRTVGMSL